MSEKVLVVRGGWSLPYGIQGWQLGVNLALSGVIMQVFSSSFDGKLGSVLGLLSFGITFFFVQMALFKLGDKMPGKTLPQLWRWINEADEYVPDRDPFTQPVKR